MLDLGVKSELLTIAKEPTVSETKKSHKGGSAGWSNLRVQSMLCCQQRGPGHTHTHTHTVKYPPLPHKSISFNFMFCPSTMTSRERKKIYQGNLLCREVLHRAEVMCSNFSRKSLEPAGTTDKNGSTRHLYSIQNWMHNLSAESNLATNQVSI